MLLNDKDAEIQSKYDGMTVEELEQQLREAFFYNPGCGMIEAEKEDRKRRSYNGACRWKSQRW